MCFGVYFAITYLGEYGPLPPSYYNDVALLPLWIVLDISMIILGFTIQRTFQERKLFLTKDGEPIHSAKSWNRGPESGLYLTSCGLVVSIDEETTATGNVGYRLVPAKRATCSDCVKIEGKAVLDSVVHGRREHPLGL